MFQLFQEHEREASEVDHARERERGGWGARAASEWREGEWEERWCWREVRNESVFVACWNAMRSLSSSLSLAAFRTPREMRGNNQDIRRNQPRLVSCSIDGEVGMGFFHWEVGVQ